MNGEKVLENSHSKITSHDSICSVATDVIQESSGECFCIWQIIHGNYAHIIHDVHDWLKWLIIELVNFDSFRAHSQLGEASLYVWSLYKFVFNYFITYK